MIKRPRRLRHNSAIRSMVRETTLNIDDLVYPLFVIEGEGVKNEISSLKGQYHYSLDKLEDEINEISRLGIQAILLFGLPNMKDSLASEAYRDTGIVQRALKEIDRKSVV